MSIADNGSIVGSADHNYQVHAYQMTLVPSVPDSETWRLTLGDLGFLGMRRTRRKPAADTDK